MRGVQVTFAFVIALMVMSAVFYGFWHYSTSQIIRELPEILAETVPGKVKYSRVESVFHPFQSKLKLIDTSISMLDPKTGASIIVDLDNITLITKPYDYRKIEVVLPEEITTVTTFQGRSNEYRTSLIDPVLEWNKMGQGYDIAFSVSGLLLKGRQNGFFANLIKIGYSYIAYGAELGQWSTVINNIDVKRIAPYTRWPIVKSLSLAFNTHSAGDFPLGYFLAASGSQNKTSFDTMLMHCLKYMSENRGIDIIESRLLVDDLWLSYIGSLNVNSELYLKLNGTLSSNKSADMMNGIKKVMNGFPLALERMLVRIGVDENKTQTISLSSNRNFLNVNGAPVGKMPSLPEQFNLHGRGER